LRKTGVTIILTTHYIEEAEEIADRIAVIDGGKILLIEDKSVLMERLGKKQLSIDLDKPLSRLPATLKELGIILENEGKKLIYNYNVDLSDSKISEILLAIRSEQIQINDVHTEQSSLEDIFIELVMEGQS
ncbi:MAG TPA: multidrug ABC transporter ATP-binding protein, partial [Gammaproteobacteria bacterium]|nr:multidrug ABC transporter ATP-binding protein [Gammaproteobacteria bacterium]